uniref:porin n=1 Tax=Hoylesella pleuritidis TaxID=407975 RepID=UPI0004691E33|nr:porin [Hoylesella pleuritidis]
MKRKQFFLMAAALSAVLQVNAQGNNTDMGGPDGDYRSLADRVLKLEKKTDAFNLYLNYAAAAQVRDESGSWISGFVNKQLRLEIKGNLTDRLFYRLCHRLNKSNTAKGADNFAKATDIMLVGYHLDNKWTVEAGKICQHWGGFEFDINPMYIYEFSDMVGSMDCYMAGVSVAYRLVPTQELVVDITNTDNGTLDEDNAALTLRNIRAAKRPFTYIVNWNGSFCGDRLQTRWSWGLQTQAQHKYSRMLIFGQKLNLPTFQWYVDYMGEFDSFDRLGIVSAEVKDVAGTAGAPAMHSYTPVHYHSLITEANWQFRPRWNVFVKGTYETASMPHSDTFKDYRKSMRYLGGVEYYPDPTQDFRVSLSYIGHNHKYTSASALTDNHTNRVELGFMYRIKCF